MPGEQFKTGAVIPDSGIYRVIHAAHRLPHEVTLLKGEAFPKCQKCADAVIFQLIRVVKHTEAVRNLSWHVVLYELPVLGEDIPRHPKDDASAYSLTGALCAI
jgi:hypothetical protein